jgi:hypothetical protein
MNLPDQMPEETFGEYRQRLNLPHVYVPYMPHGPQPEWQVELEKKYPYIMIYPYESLNVSKGLEMVHIVFEDISHITEMAREVIVRYCSSYGRDNAEKVVPSVEELRRRYSVLTVPKSY